MGAWLIDFAKTRPVPENTLLTHRLPWSPGNHEDGFLYGLDQLINVCILIAIIFNLFCTLILYDVFIYLFIIIQKFESEYFV